MKTLYFKLRPVLFLAMGISVAVFVHGMANGSEIWKTGAMFIVLFATITTLLHGVRDKFAE